jgi:hypothetical protein
MSISSWLGSTPTQKQLGHKKRDRSTVMGFGALVAAARTPPPVWHDARKSSGSGWIFNADKGARKPAGGTAINSGATT